MAESAKELLDLRKTPCPFHYFQSLKKLKTMLPGAELEIWATKLGAAELEKRLAEAGHRIVKCWEEEGTFKLQVEKR